MVTKIYLKRNIRRKEQLPMDLRMIKLILLAEDVEEDHSIDKINNVVLADTLLLE